ncbi:MAG: hypothetical protein WAM82_18195 [Thermoanaerobaculia bacterium]
MNLLLPIDIESLLEDRPGPCLSLYFPASRPGARTQQGLIHLKNLLGEVDEELLSRGLDETAIKTLLKPLKDLLADTSFWNAQEEGVALFRAPDFMAAFHLPCSVSERWLISERFFLKPLLPLVAGDHSFHVLAVSQNEVRLLEATARTVRRVEHRDLPKSLVAALGDQKEPQNLQYHTASSARGALPAIYNGTGVGKGDDKEELHRFLHQVEVAARKLLAGRRTPLVLAGAEPLPSIYRELNGYAHLAEEVIFGNPEHLTDEELRDRAWHLLEPAFQEGRRREAARYGELIGTGQASSDLTEILPAARSGRVEALFLACDTDVWGRLDPLDKVVVHAASEEGDEDLLEAAALFSLRNGGMVYGSGRGEIPGGGDLAAVFRY